MLVPHQQAWVDEMLACYIDWRADAAAVWDLYAAWETAPTCDKSSRFSAYIAALEQEESAAMTFATAVDNVARSA